MYAYEDVEYEDLTTLLTSSTSPFPPATATELGETEKEDASAAVVQDSEGKGPDGMPTRTSTRTKHRKKRTKRSINYEEREIAESGSHYWASGFGGGRVSESWVFPASKRGKS